MLLLADHEAVHEMLREFDLREDEITPFFIDHDVAPDGVIHYGVALAMAATSTTPPGVKMLTTLFVSGVALGLHLADERDTSPC